MIVKPNNKKEVILDDVKLKENLKNDSIAIMLEQSDGTYKESNTSTFPSNMLFNSEKSGCIDNVGNKIENSLTYSNGVVYVETGSTTYCYIYFDRKEEGSITLSETTGTVNQGSTHTFTVTNNLSGGSLSVTSGNDGIAIASVSGNTVTITGVSEGSTTITVTSAETESYLSSSVAYNVTVKGMVTIRIVGDGREDVGEYYGEFAYANITHNGIMYETPATFEANVGDVIVLDADAQDYINIFVNGEKFSGYEYIVTEDTIIGLGAGQYEVRDHEYCAFIDIIEVPKGQIAFTTSFFGGFDHSGVRVAKEGMTWAEWCNSEYNNDSYYRMVVDGNYIKPYSGSSSALALDGVLVKPTDAIISNAHYTTKGYPVTVTIQSENDTYAIIEVDGQVYFGNHVLTLVTGSRITCKVMEWGGKAVVTVNGNTVTSTSTHTGTYKSYTYYVKSTATIHGYYDYDNIGGRIDITEN